MDLKYYKRNYCKDIEKVENYEKAKADNFIGWICHHRLETHNRNGERRSVDIKHKELKALGMYYNRSVSELIFLTRKEHEILHKKDKPTWNKGVPKSEEQKKELSETHKGRHHYNNGKISVMCYECPPSFVPGRLRK